MRLAPALVLSLPLAICAASTVRAQQSTAAPTPVPVVVAAPPQPVPVVVAPEPVDVPLAIPTPPGGKLRVEMDARSEDLLGLMKSYLKGISETGETARPSAPGQTLSDADLVTELLRDNHLDEMLKDVNHVHFIVWELPAPPSPPAPTLDPKAKGKFLPAVSPPPPAPAFDSSAFYEDAFSREGARRLLYTDADVYKMVMVGFPNRRGFAFAVSGGGYVAVSRSDGYPDLEVLSSFISRVTTAALKSQSAKTLFKDTIGSEEGPGKGGDKK